VEQRVGTSRPLADGRQEERPWGTPPRRPPSPEDTDPSLPTTKASRDEPSPTYLHSYFDHIQGVGSFGRAKKADLTPQMHTPGPGDYHYDEKRFRSQSPRVIIARAAKVPATAETQISPGPGSYSPNMRLVHH